MQTAAEINLIFTDSSSLKRFADVKSEISYGGFYQHLTLELVKGVQKKALLLNLGGRLVGLAEHAYTFRRMEFLKQLSQILLCLPLPNDYRAFGEYYDALCNHRLGAAELEVTSRCVERVAEKGPPALRSRAMISLGSYSYSLGDRNSALCFLRDASRVIPNGHFYDAPDVHRQKMVAVIEGQEGNHSRAVILLETLFPLAQAMRLSQPHAYYDYLNSLAVELCEVGRIEEARNVSQIVVASPFAPAYPEWNQTLAEIELRGWRASRSTVSLSGQTGERQTTAKSAKLFRLPVPERGNSKRSNSVPARKPAAVFNLQEWKKRVPERTDRETRLKELEKLTTGDVITRIWGKLGDEKVRDEILCRVLLMLEDYEFEELQGS